MFDNYNAWDEAHQVLSFTSDFSSSMANRDTQFIGISNKINYELHVDSRVSHPLY